LKRVILNIHDEKKAEALLVLLRDLSYIDTQVDDNLKKWPGKLPVFNNPIYVEDFKIYSREELHAR
jgi:hypothetical protein